MLRLYRRHKVSCSHRSETYRRCQCPIYVKGTLGGESVRESLDQTSWDAASTIIASWVNKGRIGATTDGKTVGSAVADFEADAKDRGLTPATLKKYKLLLGRLEGYCEHRQSTLLSTLTLDDLSKFRATWPGGALAKSKTQERLKAFFRWCVRREWITKSPAEGLSAIKVMQSPTLPFTAEEMQKILAACDRYPTLNNLGYDNRARMKAMVLLLRWSGLRIQDAVTLKWDRITDGTLFLYTQKTGTPVVLPLPVVCISALEVLRPVQLDEVADGVGQQSFIFRSSGAGTPESAVSNWGRALRRLFRLAGVQDGHPHRFRDTFAVELLLKGVDLLDVSILLGHASVRVTQRSYAPFVHARAVRLDRVVRQSWDATGDSAA
jgi:integrase/recombinase XerD